MQLTHAVNVRTLAEFTLESGDLVQDSRAVERMREGVAGHLAVQGALERDWRVEEPLVREAQIEGVSLTVQGRADAVKRLPGLMCVEEIKTTRLPVNLIGENDYPVHWAQAQIYAWILCANEGVPNAEVSLLYYNMDGTRVRFVRNYDVARLTEIFLRLARPYAVWLKALDARADGALGSIRALKFPYPDYREGQRQLAANVFVALKNGRRLLAEAPTGIGKTAATLFGAIKALGEGHISNIFYLTARTTGRAAAEDALERMRAQGLVLHSVTITAKEKCCANPMGVHCEDCPLAAAYFDRRRPALREALNVQRLGAAALYAFAVERQLCPFELSLDLSEQADVIICDYNYAFDPRVRLRRYFDARTRAALLIDEAHNLPERARDMLSGEISARRAEHLRREVGKLDGRDSDIYRALTALLEALPSAPEQPEAGREPPPGLCEAAEQAADAIGNSLPGLHPMHGELLNFMFDCAWFARVGRMFKEETHRALIAPEGKRAGVKLWCYDPAPHILATYKRVRGAALFSATLTPLEFYARETAIREDEGDALLQLDSPFPRKNLLVLRLPVPTRFRDREQTLGDVVEAIYAMCAARPGNYLACFPSHAYLTQAWELFAARHPDVRCLRQTSGMNEAARATFLQELQPGAKQTTLAFIAMGGVFAEGVDLPGDRVIGAAIVGVGIPQLSFERDQLRQLNDDDMDEGGYEYAYVYPGMRKVAQAAGRVIRTETDLGVVLLIDSRFFEGPYRQLLPRHWRVLTAKSARTVRAACQRFWEKYGGQ